MNSIPLERKHPLDVSAHLRPADVGGIRVLGSSRVILFDKILYKIFLKQKFTIGRSQKCDIHIKDPTVSSEHCAISRLKPRGTPHAAARATGAPRRKLERVAKEMQR